MKSNPSERIAPPLSRAAAHIARIGRLLSACGCPMALLLTALLALACSAEVQDPSASMPFGASAEALQNNCGCSLTGNYVAPALSAPVTTSSAFTVATTVTNGSTGFTIKRRSDNQTVFTASAPVPTPTNPSPPVFGFSADGNRFIYRYVQNGTDNVFLVDLSTGVGRTVYSRSVVTTSSSSVFSPHGRFFVYAYVSGRNTISLNIIDATTGALSYSTGYTIYSQVVAPPGATLDIAGWGFSPDDETLVSAHVSGQGLATWDLINAVKGREVASAYISTSGYWAFSPCSDVIGLVAVTTQGNGTVSLRRTSDGATLGNASGQVLPGGILLTTSSTYQLAKINTTTFQVAPNNANSACPVALGLGSIAMTPGSGQGGQPVQGSVTLTTAAPAGGVSVALKSSNTELATVPSSVTVPAGATTAQFTVTTRAVRIASNVTITGTLGTVSKLALLQLTPPLTCFGVACAQPTQCQVSVSCNARTRSCAYTLKPVGAACDDGSPNTTGDACNDGACIGVDHCAGVSCASGQCTTGTCNHATGACTIANAPDGKVCDDGDTNTSADVCTAGACHGVDPCAGVSCPGSQCNVGSCDHTTGSCTTAPAPEGTSCDDSDATTSGDVCTAGVCKGSSGTCVETNLALNPSGAGFPDPTESDQGWGGGSYPWDLVDGLYSYASWARGLAFTGGHQTAAGGPPYIEPAGVRHAVIDFGAPKTFDKVVMWWHGAEYTPDTGTIEYWDGSTWVSAESVQRLYGTMHAEGSNSGNSDSDIYTFPSVTGSKVRYTFDNSGLNIVGTYDIHGWLYEMEAYGCP